jgi:hypothetical protein
MSAKKTDKSAYDPGWGEVILGATLSVVLGAMLGALALVLRPVAQVKELPKESVKGVTYFLEGSRDSAKARQAEAKKKAFIAGQSVVVTEDEINSFVPALPPAAPPPGAKPAAKPGEKPKAPPTPPAKGAAPAPASDEMLALGAPNVRIREGVVQIAVPVTINVLGLDQRVFAIGSGTFVKKDGSFAFEPATLLLGSCPVQRIPFAAGLVAKKFLNASAVPADIAGAWAKLADVAVDGNALKLTMP